MKINKSVLSQFISLSDKKAELSEIFQENLKTVKSRFEDEPIERVVDGKKVKCKQKDLWFELYNLGLGNGSQAEEILRGLYPETFELADKDVALAKEFNDLCFKNFGIVPSAMTISGIVNLILNLIDHKLEEHDKDTHKN